MPLYEYQCEACGRRFERIQKFSDPPVETCPTCGGKVHKLVSSPAFQFKGTGWYVTDYSRKDKGGSDAEKGEKGKGEKPSATAGSSDDKGSSSGDKSKDSAGTTTATSSSGSTESGGTTPKTPAKS